MTPKVIEQRKKHWHGEYVQQARMACIERTQSICMALAFALLGVLRMAVMRVLPLVALAMDMSTSPSASTSMAAAAAAAGCFLTPLDFGVVVAAAAAAVAFFFLLPAGVAD